MQQISGKRTVIVTGAARGIGAGIAARLARDDWNVVACDVDASALSTTSGRIGAHPIVADAGEEADVRRLVREPWTALLVSTQLWPMQASTPMARWPRHLLTH